MRKQFSIRKAFHFSFNHSFGQKSHLKLHSFHGRISDYIGFIACEKRINTDTEIAATIFSACAHRTRQFRH